jgi:hypothetical protein
VAWRSRSAVADAQAVLRKVLTDLAMGAKRGQTHDCGLEGFELNSN